MDNIQLIRMDARDIYLQMITSGKELITNPDKDYELLLNFKTENRNEYYADEEFEYIVIFKFGGNKIDIKWRDDDLNEQCVSNEGYYIINSDRECVIYNYKLYCKKLNS